MKIQNRGPPQENLKIDAGYEPLHRESGILTSSPR
jgi:hypothetical protein